MTIYDAGKVIRDRISMKEILDYYGYQPKHGFMCCPFHSEREPSLKVYQTSWHCFGCNRGGSVIDFVMEHENCSFSTAIQGIDNAFKLGLLGIQDPIADVCRRGKARLLNALADVMLEDLRLTEKTIEAKIRLKFSQVQMIEEKEKPERTADEWDELSQLLEEMEYLEYRKQRCDDLRNEVIAWRSKSNRLILKSPDDSK